MNNPDHETPGRWFWILMFGSLVAVGGVAFLHYVQAKQARLAYSNARLAAEQARAAERVATDSAGIPPVLGELPDFALTDSHEHNVSKSDLLGHVWIADFVFTYCGGPCPIMSQRMQELRAALDAEKLGDVLSVSITVDPHRDTPDVLRTYAKDYRAEPDQWIFLTGDKDRIFNLTLHGFRLAVEEQLKSDQVIHSTRFVLVDQRGRIRGYYEVLTDEEMADLIGVSGKPMPTEVKRRLLADIRKLREEAA